MTPPETQVRARVKAIFAATFAAEGWEAADDKLTRAAGKDGVTQAACYPEAARERFGAVEMLDIPVVLQLYLAYTAEPDENIVVDPTIIEGYAGRLRTAFRTQSSANDPDFWSLRLQRIEYPPDPTGNISRFEAYILGAGQNEAGMPQA